ncbi:septation protein SepH [Cellulomonas sp. McL0617]|uniref:septation protein SepH n=1 Tax=Cellulomonas sp. McL0617 TaxID=3415675 RepID=UPI003CECBB83
MAELELVGLHEDGEHLVLVGPDGARFRLRIDEPLRAAVRRDRPQLEQLRAENAGTLSPREIQARIRAGATTQEVADSAGLPVERVRRYEGPVLAEREHVAEQARGTRVGRETGAPLLGDLVTDRLAARGVDLASLAWDSARDANGPWVVLARFTVDDSEREARWTFDASKRTVVADEDEARWLSETELPDEPVSRRHLAAVRDVVFDFQPDGTTVRTTSATVVEPQPEPAPSDPLDQTAALLDDLRDRRGVRQALELDDEDTEEFEGFGPQHAFDFGRPDVEAPGAHPQDADPAQEAVVYPVPVRVPTAIALAAANTSDQDDHEGHEGHEAHGDRPRAARRGRAKVPSWDEIVFGAKPE